MHGTEDVAVTLKNVTFVPEVPFDLCSFDVIQEDRAITLEKEGAHTFNGRVFSERRFLGNYIEATQVPRHENPLALASAVIRHL